MRKDGKTKRVTQDERRDARRRDRRRLRLAQCLADPADPGRLPGPEPGARPDRPEPARPLACSDEPDQRARSTAIPGAGNLLGNLLCAVAEPAQPDGCARPADRRDQPPRRRAERDPGARPDEPRDRRRPPSPDASPHAAAGCPRGTLRPAWSSSPASSPRAPSTWATTSAASCSTSPARTAATRRSTASSTCTRSRSPTTAAQLRERTYDLFALFVAAGLDPERSILFRQSDVKEHTELAWLLSSVIPLGELNRMHQFRDKSVQQREMVRSGLLFYPVLMAADVLAYRAHEVPVGEDQREHLEVMRDAARTLQRALRRDAGRARGALSRRSARACSTSRTRRARCPRRAAPSRAPSTCSTSPTWCAASSSARRPTPGARSSAPPTSPASPT